MAAVAKKKIKRPLTILGARPVDLENYIKFAEEKDVIRLSVQEHGVDVTIERGAVVAAPVVSVPTPPPSAELKESQGTNAEENKIEKIAPESSSDDDKYTKVTSPIVGTFYEAPSPSSPPFVKVGDVVDKGQTLCIVEAMKVMNKINSEVKGKIVKVLPEDAQPVKQGEILFLIDPV